MIVCSRATADWVVPGSVFVHSCGKCGEKVMMAPSGQRILKASPEGSVIMCDVCYGPLESTLRKVCGDPTFADSVEEVAREVNSAVPNTYRTRN